MIGACLHMGQGFGPVLPYKFSAHVTHTECPHALVHFPGSSAKGIMHMGQSGVSYVSKCIAPV